jgi:tetratricopeptide (TPR) repeat protein
MDRLKIVVYAIAKDESKHVARFCEAARDADMIFVADTGSTDNTVSLLEDHGATVVHLSIKPWRFDDARNAALAMLPEDFDVCVSLDLDEVLQPGWRAEIERVWTDGTTRLRYGFDWGRRIVFQYDKIHARRGYRWLCPVHEYPVPDRIVERYADTDMLMVIHKPDDTKSRGQYLDLLRISTEENPTEPRNAFYYARELSFVKNWGQAIHQAQRYLDLPRATWPNERSYAMRVIAQSYGELKKWALALEWARRACSEAEHTRESWCELARLCYLTQRWAECYGAAMTCLSIENREKLYTTDPAVWGWQPHDWASIAAWNMGLKEEALKHAKIASEMAPDDMRLRRNVSEIEKGAA